MANKQWLPKEQRQNYVFQNWLERRRDEKVDTWLKGEKEEERSTGKNELGTEISGFC